MGGVSYHQPEVPSVENYTITFESAGGSAVEAISVEKGKIITSAPTSEKNGYELDGWYNGETKVDFPFTPTSDVTLTAKWTAIVYTITYLPEGIESENPTTYTILSETILLKNPTKALDTINTEFVAWHNGEKPTEGNWTIVDKIEKGSTGNLTLIAEFSNNAKWDNALPSYKGATFTVNEDGTVSGTCTAKNDGNGIVLYINKDKSSVAAGSKVKFAFDYEILDGWHDENVKPRFKLDLLKDATDYWGQTSLTSDNLYHNAENTKGTMTITLLAKEECNQLLMHFNTYEWQGAETDSIKITLKALKVISPDENANLKIDLDGKKVKNSEAFANAFSGFVTEFDAVDISEYSELRIEAKFFDDSNNEIEIDYGLGLFKLLKNPNGSWDDYNTIKHQYNLGKAKMDLPFFEDSVYVTSILFQNTNNKVKFIEISNIEFIK